MGIKYYYIDDDPKTTIEETAKGLSVYPSRLKIEAFQHESWDNQLAFIIDHQNSFDGLILDWSLNNKNSKGDNANYNVEALAQQLRRLIIDNEKIKKDFPIVLCSANYKFKDTFSRELTGHDLFDLVFEKDDFDTKQEIIINQLEDLANGYKIIAKDNSIENIFCVKQVDEVDYRIVDHLQNQKKEPPHEISRFLFTKIINANGVLIDEYLLAARCGVDIIDEKNLSEWEKLKDLLKGTKYCGVFSNGWQRWWMNKVTSFWEEHFQSSPGSILGEKRVEILNSKFGIKLTPAKIFEKGNSSAFWVICKKTLRPLAIEDAVLCSSDINKPAWEEDEYFSVKVALEEDIKTIHPLEKDRVKKLKELFAKVRPK